MTDPAGKTANKTGSDLEKTVAHILEMNGYVELDASDKMLVATNDVEALDLGHSRWFVQQIIKYPNIYGAMGKADFLIFSENKFPKGLLIETKWQGVAGSVDEKYAFTVLSLKALDIPSMLVLDGTGARIKAINWIKNEARKSKGRFTFNTLPEFMVWVRNNL